MRGLMLLLAAVPALGCSCGARPSPKDAWLGVPLVFVGFVTKVDPAAAADPLDDYSKPQSVWLRVQEPFRGVTAAQTVQLSQEGGCWGKMRIGERALFYVHAGPQPGTWQALPCYRTRHLDRAADDLLFLRTLPRSAQGTRLSGTVYNDWKLPPRSLAGIPVRISAPGLSFELRTDAQGVFEIYGLLPGEYRVEPIVPKDLKVQAAAISNGATAIVLRKDAGVSLESSIFSASEPGVKAP